jgi:hypothetical protein
MNTFEHPVSFLVGFVSAYDYEAVVFLRAGAYVT